MTTKGTDTEEEHRLQTVRALRGLTIMPLWVLTFKPLRGMTIMPLGGMILRPLSGLTHKDNLGGLNLGHSGNGYSRYSGDKPSVH